MSEISDIFQSGFFYLYSLEAFPHIGLLIALFAILKLSDIKKGLFLVLSFAAGFLVNLLLLSYQIFSLQNEYLLGLISLSSVLFALWNFSFKTSTYQSKSSNISSRYLIAFLLGVLHGIYIFFGQNELLLQTQILGVFSYWSGLLLSILLFLMINFIVLWVMSNFFRVKEENWMLVISGIAIGFSSAVYFII